MSSKIIVPLVLALTFLCASASAQVPEIGPTGPISRTHQGLIFTEGPAADAEGNVYFTDVQANRVYKSDVQGSLSTFLENSQGCNGLMFDGRGRLTAAQGTAGRIIAIDIATKAVTVLADQFQGKRFNRPNDLVVDALGGVYFTDPLFGGGGASQDVTAVYYVSASGTVTRIISDLTNPNGVILSPDEKTLYVLHGQPNVMAYPVTAPGQIGAGRVLVQLQSSGGGDGMSVDTRGNLYVTRPAINSLQVVTPTGQSLGLIQFQEAPANCTFGGADLKTLYVTARTSVYTARMSATGHRFGGPLGDFELSAAPDTQTVAAGGSTSFVASVTGTGGFSQTVGLAATVSPANSTLTIALSPESVVPGGVSTVTVQTTAATPSGAYAVAVVGTAGTRTRAAQVVLNVSGGLSDTQKPVVSNVALSKSKVKRKKDAVLVITWTSSDNVGVASHAVLYATDGTNFTTTVTTGLSGATKSFAWTVPDTLAKTKAGVVKIVAADAAGNVGEAASAAFTIK